MRLVILGLTITSRGGIPQYTNLLYETCSARHQTYIVPIVRTLFRGAYRSKNNQETGEAISSKGSSRPLPNLDPLNPYSWWSTARMIAKLEPDIVIVTWWATTYWILSIGIVTDLLHRLSPHTRVIYWSHDVRANKQSRIWTSLIHYSLSQADEVLVHSKRQEEALLDTMPNATSKVTPLPLLTNTFPDDNLSRYAARQKLGISSTAEVALFFGTVTSYKGLEDLLYASAKARTTLRDLHLIVAGEFWEPFQPYLDRVQKLRLEPFTTIVNRYIPDEEVQLYFRSADVLVLPYRDATQSGVARVGMEFGLPIIATGTGEFPEIIVDRVSGMLVQPGDVDALSQALIDFFMLELGPQLADGIQLQRDALSPEVLMNVIEQTHSLNVYPTKA